MQLPERIIPRGTWLLLEALTVSCKLFIELDIPKRLCSLNATLKHKGVEPLT